MSEVRLKSYDFRRDRERAWRELDSLVHKADRGGIKSLSADELMRLPILYRAALSSLSVARSISLDQNVLRYLENLAARAYFAVYGVHASALSGIFRFFAATFPNAVRAARWHILVSFVVSLLGFATAYLMTQGSEDWFYTFIPDEMAQGRTPAASTEELEATIYQRGSIEGSLHIFASFLFQHNAKIGMLCFALGFALGVPVILLLFYNGLTLGAFVALFASRDLGPDVWAWLLIHGTTELLAVVICGGAGLYLGAAVAFPGTHTRLENLAREGRRASCIVVGAVAMFFAAALLEGFGRQLVQAMETRFLVGAAMLALWGLYFLWPRQEARRDVAQ